MAAELKHLLERIQKEGVEEAESQADTILAKAKEEAGAITADAEAKAKAMIEAAEREAEAHAQRGTQALKQAGRDVVLSVGESVTKLFEGLVQKRVDQALNDETLRQMLTAVVTAYVGSSAGSAKLAVLMSEKDQAAVVDTFLRELAEELKGGVTVSGDDRIVSGFRVSVAGEHVEHDFTGEAVRASLCELLRPHLAEIVKSALPAQDPE